MSPTPSFPVARASHLRLVCFALVASAVLMAPPAAQSQSSGVQCPANFTTNFAGGVLRCQRQVTVTKPSVCPPTSHLLHTTMVSIGSDTCLPQVSGNAVPSAMGPLLPGDPPLSAFRRVVSQRGVDRFEAQKIEFTYPAGHIFLGTTPDRGVRCPNTSGVVPRFANNVLRCVKEETTTRNANCTPGWRFQQNRGRDFCVNIINQNQDPTLPEGQISRDGWTLLVDNSGTRDAWRRTTTSFFWPNPR